MEMKKDQYAKERRRWLQEYSWSWSANLKLPADTNRMRREYMFDNWISALRYRDGTADFHWVSVAEARFMKTRPEFHVLIGGLRSRLEYWASQWNQVGGTAIIEKFDPKRNEASFLPRVDAMGDEDTLEVESEFPQGTSGDSWVEEVLKENDRTIKLRVNRLDEDTSLAELRSQFEIFGKVEEISLHTGETLSGQTVVYALVTLPLKNARRAKRLLKASDGPYQDVMWPRRFEGPWFSLDWRPRK